MEWLQIVTAARMCARIIVKFAQTKSIAYNANRDSTCSQTKHAHPTLVLPTVPPVNLLLYVKFVVRDIIYQEINVLSALLIVKSVQMGQDAKLVNLNMFSKMGLVLTPISAIVFSMPAISLFAPDANRGMK